MFQLTDHDVLAGFDARTDNLSDEVDALGCAAGKNNFFTLGRVDNGLGLAALTKA